MALNSDIYFDFKGPKSLKIYAWYSHVKTNHNLRPNRASDQKVEGNRPPFLWKKWDCAIFNFLIWVLLRPQIAIRSCATISRVNFSRFGHLQIKISDKIFLGHNPLGIFNRSGFGNVKKLINEWKTGTWKIIVCKKPKFFIITSSGFAQFWNSISYTLAWFLYLWQSNQSSKLLGLSIRLNPKTFWFFKLKVPIK